MSHISCKANIEDARHLQIRNTGGLASPERRFPRYGKDTTKSAHKARELRATEESFRSRLAPRFPEGSNFLGRLVTEMYVGASTGI